MPSYQWTVFHYTRYQKKCHLVATRDIESHSISLPVNYSLCAQFNAYKHRFANELSRLIALYIVARDQFNYHIFLFRILLQSLHWATIRISVLFLSFCLFLFLVFELLSVGNEFMSRLNYSKGDEIQKLSVIQSLPNLLAGDAQSCISKVLPKMQQSLPTASVEFHIAASAAFKTILEQKLVTQTIFTQLFLQSILTSLDNKDFGTTNLIQKTIIYTFFKLHLLINWQKLFF